MLRRSVVLSLGLVILGAPLVATPAIAADEASTQTGIKAEILASISDAQSKLEQLAEAIPAAKYTWRPGKGVRSPAEVFMHVAASNYGMPGFWGVKSPAGFNFQTYEHSLTAKADIRKALADSFVFVKNALAATPDADLDKPVELFGMKTTVRGGFLLIATHCHEHLGQLIAYARINGVVPPWTAKQQAEEAKALANKQKGGGM
jgi:uncharacterized damage-inducible protein DinB